MKKILIRADDLGYSKGVNYGIADSVKYGIIKSVGVMTNMPDTIHGLELLKNEHVVLGLHTNICVGRPLTDPKLIPSLVNEHGEFKSSRQYRNSKEDFVVLEEVLLEIEAQYLRFVELVGEKPHYFEGHAIQSDNFYKGLKIISDKHGCDYLEINFSGPSKFRNSILYAVIESMKPDYDSFESLKNAVNREYPDGGIPMMICHPGYLDDYILKTSSMTTPRTMEVELACSEKTKNYIKDNHIQVITYDDLS